MTVTQTVSVYDTLRYSQDFSSAYLWATVRKYSQDTSPSQRYNVFGRNTISGAQYYHASCIPIGALSFSGVPSKLSLTFKCYSREAHTYRWAICTSDANKSMYQGTKLDVPDAYQVARGTFSLETYGTAQPTITIDLVSRNIPSGVPLFVFIWAYEDGGIAAHIESGDITVTLEYSPSIGSIDTGEAFESFTINIDNGTTWAMYMAYVDTGTGWILLT